jgi:hypothetical protein
MVIPLMKERRMTLPLCAILLNDDSSQLPCVGAVKLCVGFSLKFEMNPKICIHFSPRSILDKSSMACVASHNCGSTVTPRSRPLHRLSVADNKPPTTNDLPWVP